MRKTLAYTLIAASLFAGGSAFARGAGNEGFNVMSPATPDPEAVLASQLNNGWADLGQQIQVPSRIQGDTAVPAHAGGQENALYGS